MFIVQTVILEVWIINKRQREAAERAMLKHMLDTKPKYKEIMDALIDNPNKELKDIIQPIIEDQLKTARAIGVNIGWQSAWLRAYDKVKDMQSVDEIKACLRSEADAVREKMGLKSAFDKDGNFIVEEDEEHGKSL